MKSPLATFNCILFLVLSIFVSGCETTKDPGTANKADKTAKAGKKGKKEYSTVDLFLETSAQANAGNAAPIYRQNPVYVPVESQPFLNLANVEDAAVVNYMDGFMIQIRFDAHGTFVLDTTSTANRGKRIAVFAKFPEPRWLAAPQITQRNATGIVAFTPDATREEAERFVRGIKTAVAEIKKRERF